MLQQSLLCCIYREVARDLSKCCSKLGLVHAAVLFEHATLGASVSLQYRGILHSKLLALERRHLCGSATPEAEQASHIVSVYCSCFMHRLLHAQAAPCIRCFMHRLLHAQAASCSRCFMLTLLHAHAASCTRCFMHTLLHAHAASCTRCFMRTLLHAHAASCARCFMHTLLHAHAALTSTGFTSYHFHAYACCSKRCSESARFQSSTCALMLYMSEGSLICGLHPSVQ